jgi:hypothetical protein
LESEDEGTHKSRGRERAPCTARCQALAPGTRESPVKSRRETRRQKEKEKENGRGKDERGRGHNECESDDESTHREEDEYEHKALHNAYALAHIDAQGPREGEEERAELEWVSPP